MSLFFRLLDFILLPFFSQSFKPPLGSRLLSYPLLVNNLKQTWLWDNIFYQFLCPWNGNFLTKETNEGRKWHWTSLILKKAKLCKAWRLTPYVEKKGGAVKISQQCILHKKTGQNKEWDFRRTCRPNAKGYTNWLFQV